MEKIIIKLEPRETLVLRGESETQWITNFKNEVETFEIQNYLHSINLCMNVNGLFIQLWFNSYEIRKGDYKND